MITIAYYTEKLKQFFGNKEVVAFLFAVCCRLFFVYVYPTGGTDHDMQHVAAENFLQHNGLTFLTSNASDLSEQCYHLMKQWPPLTALLLSLFTYITNSEKNADLLLMVFGILALFVTLRLIVRILGLKKKTSIILWLILAVNPDPFFGLGISDLYSSVFYLLSIYCCYQLLTASVFSFWKSLLFSLVFFLPAAFRYQYYPLIFIFPAILLTKAVITKEKKLIKNGLYSLLLVFFLIALQISISFLNSGGAVYIADDIRGFFPENIFKIYAFILKGFFPVTYLENHLTNLDITYFLLYKILIWLITLGFLFFYFQRIKNIIFDSWFQKNNKGLVEMLLFISSTTAFTLLLILSVRFHAQGESWFSFTYISEARYFLPITLSVLLLLAKITEERTDIFRFRSVILLLILTFNYSLWTKFLYNTYTGNLPETKQLWDNERLLITYKIQQLIDSTGLPVVGAGNKDFLYLPIYKNYSIIDKTVLLKLKTLQTSNPVLLAYITKEKTDKKDSAFIKETKADLVFFGTKSRIYILTVNPSKTN